MELHGAKGPSNKIVDGRDFGEQLRKGKRAYLLQLNSLNLGEKQEVTEGNLNPKFIGHFGPIFRYIQGDTRLATSAISRPQNSVGKGSQSNFSQALSVIPITKKMRLKKWSRGFCHPVW